MLACGQPRSISATLNHCIQQKTSGTQGGANVYPIAGVTLAQGLPSFLVNRPSLKSSIVVQLHVPLVIQQYHSLVLGERELDSFMSFSTRQKKRYFSWINGLNHRPLLHDKNPSANVYYEFCHLQICHLTILLKSEHFTSNLRSKFSNSSCLAGNPSTCIAPPTSKKFYM